MLAQVHAVVSRLCDPIAGLDSSHLAQWLGLDPSLYTKRLQAIERNEGDVSMPGGVYIDSADPLRVKCCNKECAQINEVNEVCYWKGRGREGEREGNMDKGRDRVLSRNFVWREAISPQSQLQYNHKSTQGGSFPPHWIQP